MGSLSDFSVWKKWKLEFIEALVGTIHISYIIWELKI